MNKRRSGPQPWLYPTPALLIGTDVEGRPNFMTAAWAGIACSTPPMVTIGIVPSHHTMKGVMAHREFSVNVPSASLVQEVDFCGIESGAKTDKTARCGFKVFSGVLQHAPLIEQCPVNVECTLEHVVDLGSHTLVVGRIVETHVSEDCTDTEGLPDYARIDPISYLPSPARCYARLGEVVGEGYRAGKTLQ